LAHSQYERFGERNSLSPFPGFEHRAVYPVASRYTDWAVTQDTELIMRKITGNRGHAVGDNIWDKPVKCNIRYTEYRC